MKTENKTILKRFAESMKRAFTSKIQEDPKPEPEPIVAKVIMLRKKINGNNSLEVLKEQTLQ